MLQNEQLALSYAQIFINFETYHFSKKIKQYKAFCQGLPIPKFFNCLGLRFFRNIVSVTFVNIERWFRCKIYGCNKSRTRLIQLSDLVFIYIWFFFNSEHLFAEKCDAFFSFIISLWKYLRPYPHSNFSRKYAYPIQNQISNTFFIYFCTSLLSLWVICLQISTFLLYGGSFDGHLLYYEEIDILNVLFL